MGKLRMKRTPEEQAVHDLKKAKKAARKAARRAPRPSSDHGDTDRPRKRRRLSLEPEDSADDGHDGPHAGSSRLHKPDYDAIRAEVEEDRFRDKLWSALDDDERLDSVEAKLNSYAHIPRRWRSGGMDRMEDDLDIDPQMMEDEDYAEWMRMGMWRKKHAAEHEEQVRIQQEQAARRAREEAVRAETRRLERQAEEERRRRRKEKEHQRVLDAREHYETRWRELLTPSTAEGPQRPLRFLDIPWPVFFSSADLAMADRELDIITADAISTFLLPLELFPPHSQDSSVKKERRERLREAMLRFHPDKFEGRILGRVEERDRDRTKEAVAKVVVALNHLMATVDQ